MTIAVFISNTRSADQPLWECTVRLAGKFPEHHFIVFSDRSVWESNSDNITPVIIQPAIKNGLMLHYWSQYKLPSILKRYDSDIFISENSALCLRSRIPQLLMITDRQLSEENISTKYPLRSYLKRIFPWFVRKASMLITVQEDVAKKLISKFKLFEDKVSCISFGVSGKALSWKEKDEEMQRYTAGHDYFLFQTDNSHPDEIRDILKAFSIFKKWQKSSIKMVLLSFGTNPDPIKDLQTYKYRDDVRLVITENRQEFYRLIAGSFSLIHTNDSLIPFHAMNMMIPVICADTDLNRERYKDAVIYANKNPQQIAEQMMRVYKDENIQKEITAKGKELSAIHDWEASSLRLWETIVEHTQS